MEIKIEGVAYTIDEGAISIGIRLPGGIKNLSLDGLSQEDVQVVVDKWMNESLKEIQ